MLKAFQLKQTKNTLELNQTTLNRLYYYDLRLELYPLGKWRIPSVSYWYGPVEIKVLSK